MTVAINGAGKGSGEDGSEGSKSTSLRWWSLCRCLGCRAGRSGRNRIENPIDATILRFQAPVHITAIAATITVSGRCSGQGGSAASSGAAGSRAERRVSSGVLTTRRHDWRCWRWLDAFSCVSRSLLPRGLFATLPTLASHSAASSGGRLREKTKARGWLLAYAFRKVRKITNVR